MREEADLICVLYGKAELDDSVASSSVPHVKATQVTTRTALTKEDKETNSTTSQIQEKTFTATTTTTGLRQEQRVVTQEVRTATILTNAEPAVVSPALDIASGSAVLRSTPLRSTPEMNLESGINQQILNMERYR